MSVLDLNKAESQLELIPAGTIAKATLKLKGEGNYGEHNLLYKSDYTGSIGLNVSFTIEEGKYKNRKIFQLIGIEGTKKDENGEDIWGRMGKKLIRAIVESAHNIHPNDKTDKAIKIRNIESYNDLEGLVCVIKIGIEEDKTGKYDDKNKAIAALTPADKNYTTIMNTPINRTEKPTNTNDDEYINDDIPF